MGTHMRCLVRCYPLQAATHNMLNSCVVGVKSYQDFYQHNKDVDLVLHIWQITEMTMFILYFLYVRGGGGGEFLVLKNNYL